MRAMLNNKTKKEQKGLSFAELKSCKGFENYTDEEAVKTIGILGKLSLLIFQAFMKQQQKEKKRLSVKCGKTLIKPNIS